MENKIECVSCKTLNPEDSNFCKMCGFALTANGKVLREQLKINAKIELLNDLSSVVNDKETLYLLKAYSSRLLNK